jgi:alkanesulfonate monooxygenase SsuD/methylene tetrahydromethanopterin reductase-like flavin-dependent oxidoreductase (luciferase family)
VAELLNQEPQAYSQGRMTYDLRRLHLHGLIERQPHSNRYRVTQEGVRIILFLTRAEARFFRVVLAIKRPLDAGQAPRVLVQASQAVDRLIQATTLAA